MGDYNQKSEEFPENESNKHCNITIDFSEDGGLNSMEEVNSDDNLEAEMVKKCASQMTMDIQHDKSNDIKK